MDSRALLLRTVHRTINKSRNAVLRIMHRRVSQIRVYISVAIITSLFCANYISHRFIYIVHNYKLAL